MAVLDAGCVRHSEPEWFAAFCAYMVLCGRITRVKRTIRQLIKVGRKAIPDIDLERIDVPTVPVGADMIGWFRSAMPRR
ncbi:MAG: hypothetical protein ACRDH0_11440 [Actinomycetota bacterium]